MDKILARRSIRKYTQQPVADEEINKLLQAAMSAPSAGNEQPWHFIVIRDRVVLNEIPKFHPFAQALKEAAAAIIVCGDPGLEKFKGCWVQDCSAATENILLAAQYLGLGVVWCGIYPNQERVEAFQKLLGIPQNVIPLSMIPLGYPNEQKLPANRYDETRIHRDRW